LLWHLCISPSQSISKLQLMHAGKRKLAYQEADFIHGHLALIHSTK
jgi:hypothetical protein